MGVGGEKAFSPHWEFGLSTGPQSSPGGWRASAVVDQLPCGIWRTQMYALLPLGVIVDLFAFCVLLVFLKLHFPLSAPYFPSLHLFFPIV